MKHCQNWALRPKFTQKRLLLLQGRFGIIKAPFYVAPYTPFCCCFFQNILWISLILKLIKFLLFARNTIHLSHISSYYTQYCKSIIYRCITFSRNSTNISVQFSEILVIRQIQIIYTFQLSSMIFVYELYLSFIKNDKIMIKISH